MKANRLTAEQIRGNGWHLRISHHQALAILHLLSSKGAGWEELDSIVKSVLGKNFPDVMIVEDAGFTFANITGNCGVLVSDCDDGRLWWSMQIDDGIYHEAWWNDEYAPVYAMLAVVAGMGVPGQDVEEFVKAASEITGVEYRDMKVEGLKATLSPALSFEYSVEYGEWIVEAGTHLLACSPSSWS